MQHWRCLCRHGAVLALLAVSACTPDEEPAARQSACLVGATERPTFLALSEEEANAVVAVRSLHPVTGEVERICSGIVVGETAVLTAAHCAAPSLEIVIGPSLTCPHAVVVGPLQERHPDVDVALLEAEGLTAIGGVAPIPWIDADIDASWLGQLVQLAGFGSDLWGPPDARRFLVQAVTALSSATVTVDG